VYSGEKGDLSYIDSAYRGVFRAQEDYVFDKREFSAFDYDAIAGLLNTPGPDRPLLVITASYAFANDTRRLATAFPDVNFVGLDQRGSDLPNLRTAEITSYGGSFLAGVLAAQATKTGRVGIILGTRSALLEAFREGYADGVHAVNPSITVDAEYIEQESLTAFNDPDRAQVIARKMYENGADIIYTVAGYSGFGAIREAKRAPGRYIIGVDSDQTNLGPAVVLASMVKHMDTGVYYNIGWSLGGAPRSGEIIIGLRDGGTELVFNPKFARYRQGVLAWNETAMDAEERYLALNPSHNHYYRTMTTVSP
jgi:basic membrane protein A